MTDQSAYHIPDALIGQDACFAIFRLPHETSLRFVMQTSGTPSVLRDIDELNGQRGFVIAPFRATAASPLLVIRPDLTTFPDTEITGSDKLPEKTDFYEDTESLPFSGKEKFTEQKGFHKDKVWNGFSDMPDRVSPPEESDKSGFPDKTDSNNLSWRENQKNLLEIIEQEANENNGKPDYNRLFKKFHQPLADGKMKKLVLSRCKTIDRKETFSPGRAFFNAVEKYPYSYVYLFHTPQSGTWMGSTPEILLTGRKEEWHTIALAGTRYPNCGAVTWDDKNLREQHLVTSYLLKQLSSFHITPEINGPYTVKAGNLAHLRTDINFHLPDSSKPGTLLKALHPTPAVSGLPKDDAFRFIRENEGYNRLYYSGFLGMLDTEGETGIYVNLRCMHIGKKSLTLFAGSGLLASSTPDDEWEETEQKLKTMSDILE